jgi:3-phosphoshikimate 1-carboxyvinyltransferase
VAVAGVDPRHLQGQLEEEAAADLRARVEELPDGWRVARGRARDASVQTHGDHRLAIAFAVAAATGVAGEVAIDDARCASVSYPSFWDDLERTSRADAA